MAVQQLPDGRWACYYRDPITKKQVREYFGRGPEGKAKANQRDKELSLKKGRPRKNEYGPTFSDLANLYFRKKGFDRKPKETLSYRLEGAILPEIGHFYAMNLTINHLDDYVTTRRLDGIADNSIAREITDIKAILNWSAKRNPPLIPFNPVREFKAPAGRDKVFIPPDKNELDAIYKNACPHLKRFIVLCCYLGARPGEVEILSLKWESVSWSSRTIQVISADKGGPPYRDVFILDDLYAMLEQWYSEDMDRFKDRAGKLNIVHFWGEKITTVKRAWKSALTKAKITRRIRPYDMRHRFVTTALEKGADIGALADIVGSRPETLRKYYQHVSRELHRQTLKIVGGSGIRIMPKKSE